MMSLVVMPFEIKTFSRFTSFTPLPLDAIEPPFHNKFVPAALLQDEERQTIDEIYSSIYIYRGGRI